MGDAPVFVGAAVDAVCGETLRVVERRFVCDGISIFEVSVPPTLLRFAATKTIARDQLKDFKLRLGVGLAGTSAQENQGLICNDVSTDPRFHSLPDRAFRFTTKSVMCCPMRVDGRVVGVIELVNKANDEPFTESELQHLQQLADIVAREWVDEESAAKRTTFDLVMIQAIDIAEVDGVSVLTMDEDGNSLSFKHSVTAIKTSLAGVRLNVGQGIVGWVAEEAMPIFVEDVQKDERFFKGVDSTSTFSTKSVLAVPVMVAGQPRVVVEVVNSQASDSFVPQDLQTLEGIANQLAIRLEPIVASSSSSS